MEELGIAKKIDPNTICPVSGEVCPDRQLIVELFTEHVPVEAEIPIPGFVGPDTDGPKMQHELSRHEQSARNLGCQSDVDGVCVTQAAWKARLSAEREQLQHEPAITIGSVLTSELLHAHL
jgi:hypothetical protein